MRFDIMLTTAALALIPVCARAQAHEERLGEFALRSSVVNSEALPPSTAQANGIERSPRRAVVNVIVTRSRVVPNKTIPADVHVRTTTLAGRRRDVPMHEVISNGAVSYLGVFDFLPREVRDFTVTATPEGTRRTLQLHFRERLWKPR